MKYFKKYKHIIALKERAAGNESVGNMWIETKTFPSHTPISEVVDWAKNCEGRLIITIDETNAEDTF